MGAWVSSVALSKGWHLNVPVAPTGLLAAVGLLLLDRGTSLVGEVWHQEKIKATPQIATLNKMAEHYVAATAPGLIDPMAQAFLRSRGL